MAKADKRVQIIERDGEFYADPPYVELDPGSANNSKMKIVNRTDQECTWVVTSTTLFQGGIVAEPVAAKGLSTLKTVANAAAPGVYEYQVIMKNGKKAKGNSDPVIIIDG